MKIVLRVTSIVVFLFFTLQVIVFPVVLHDSYFSPDKSARFCKLSVNDSFVLHSPGGMVIHKSVASHFVVSKAREDAKISLDGCMTALFQIEAARVYIDKGLFISSFSMAP
jgi:hypothetical protein